MNLTMIFIFNVLFVVKILGIKALNSNDLGSLVLANVIFRHGDRTPISPYPTDPYQNLSLWTVGWGQLTNKGKEHHYELGKWFRQRYENFLPLEYFKDDIYVQSTDVDRTLMSAESNLAGLYPPSDQQKWNPKIAWQPVPVHTTPEIEDKVLAAKRPCPLYNREFDALMNSDEMKKFNQKNKELYSYLSKHSGLEINDVVSLENLFDTLHVEELNNLTLPDWTQSVYPEKMARLAIFSFALQAFTPLMQRLKSGPLLKELISNMEKVIYGPPDAAKKMYMYSGHDTTIANLLMTLGVFDHHCPPYVATVMMELREKPEKNFVVVISYKNSTKEPSILTLPGCTAICPYEKFVSLTKSRVPWKWEEECALEVLYEFRLNALSIVALALSGFLAILLTSSILFSILYWRKKKSSSYYYHQVHTEEQ